MTQNITYNATGVRTHRIKGWIFSSKPSTKGDGLLITARRINREAKGAAIRFVDDAIGWPMECNVPVGVIASFIGTLTGNGRSKRLLPGGDAR